MQPYAYDNMTRKDHDVLVAQDRAKLKGYSVSCSRRRGLCGTQESFEQFSPIMAVSSTSMIFEVDKNINVHEN